MTIEEDQTDAFPLKLSFGNKLPNNKARIKLSWKFSTDDYFIVKRNGQNVGATDYQTYVDLFEHEGTVDVEYQVCTSGNVCSETKRYRFITPKK